MPKKPSIVSEQTKDNIKNAFWSLYCKKRIEKITVGEVVKIAGYNRSTFYQYFTDIYDVLECIEDALIPEKCKLPPINATIPKSGFGDFISFYENNSVYYKVLLGDKGDPAFQSRIKSTLKAILIEDLNDNEYFDMETVEYVLEYVLSAMIGILSYWYNHETPMEHSKLITLIQKLSSNELLASMSSLRKP